MDMQMTALISILDGFKLRKTPRTKIDVVERIIQKIIRENDPWLVRSQQYWNSSEELFWPPGQGPRWDLGQAEVASSRQPSDELDRADIDSIMSTDSVSCIGSQRDPSDVG